MTLPLDKDAYIKKLERRIHMQRLRLRWWEQMFNTHVRGHYWRKVASVRADLLNVAKRHGLARRAETRRKDI